MTNPVEKDPIEYNAPTITEKAVQDFRSAIGSLQGTEVSPTYVTCYRLAEFDWLHRLGVTLQYLLHAEQEYEFLRPLKVGDTPKVSTTLENLKERKMGGGRLIVIDLKTDVTVAGELKAIARTKFMVREPGAVT